MKLTILGATGATAVIQDSVRSIIQAMQGHRDPAVPAGQRLYRGFERHSGGLRA